MNNFGSFIQCCPFFDGFAEEHTNWNSRRNERVLNFHHIKTAVVTAAATALATTTTTTVVVDIIAAAVSIERNTLAEIYNCILFILSSQNYFVAFIENHSNTKIVIVIIFSYSFAMMNANERTHTSNWWVDSMLIWRYASQRTNNKRFRHRQFHTANEQMENNLISFCNFFSADLQFLEVKFQSVLRCFGYVGINIFSSLQARRECFILYLEAWLRYLDWYWQITICDR